MSLVESEPTGPFVPKRAIKAFTDALGPDGQINLDLYQVGFAEMVRMIKLFGGLFSFAEILFKRHTRIMKGLQNGKHGQHYTTVQDMFDFEKANKKRPGSTVFREFHITTVFAVGAMERYCREPVTVKLSKPSMEAFKETLEPIQPKFINKVQMLAMKKLPTLDFLLVKIYPWMNDEQERYELAMTEIKEATKIIRRITLLTEDIMVKHGFKEKIVLLPPSYDRDTDL